MKNTLFNHQIRHQSTPWCANSLYIKQQFAVCEADQRLPTCSSAALLERFKD
jgi:hypothetical protein